jgi:glycosyltransferase involved in cell wall biosynthesis
MKKTISYLVPSYNHAKYLLILLESIKSDIQSLSVPAEVVIVDDGSTDNSAELIEIWVKKNKENIDINVYISPVNKGIPATFNNLVDMSSGDFLRFSGSDDILVQGSTQKLLEAFSHSPSLICTFGDATVIDGDGKTTHISSIAYHGGSIAKISNSITVANELINHWCLAGPSILIKKSHYENMRYDESLNIDDYDLFMSLLEIKNSVLFIDAIVCNYRVHGANTSKTHNIAKRIDNLSSFLGIIEKYMHRGLLRNALISVKYKTIAKIFYLKKNYLVASKYLIISYFFGFKNKLFK